MNLEEKKIPLLNEKYETYNAYGNHVSKHFKNMIECFIEEKMKQHSSIELEYILMSELTLCFAEKRMVRNAKISKSKREKSDP